VFLIQDCDTIHEAFTLSLWKVEDKVTLWIYYIPLDYFLYCMQEMQFNAKLFNIQLSRKHAVEISLRVR
jgi:hypothetical protein